MLKKTVLSTIFIFIMILIFNYNKDHYGQECNDYECAISIEEKNLGKAISLLEEKGLKKVDSLIKLSDDVNFQSKVKGNYCQKILLESDNSGKFILSLSTSSECYANLNDMDSYTYYECDRFNMYENACASGKGPRKVKLNKMKKENLELINHLKLNDIY